MSFVYGCPNPTATSEGMLTIELLSLVDGARHDLGNANLQSRSPGLDLTPTDFSWLVAQMTNVAEVCCKGRIIVCLEGGYGRYSGANVDLREFGLNATMSVAALLKNA